ncbi:ABC transporter permease [Novosphingobium pentaromativorans]|uniref:ABC transporter permease n=1 Tax=Novosphingobium pentaromativorans TaxID=205844 RepID=UPI000305EFCF|nr:ABC transporter permease [Novosphingobium pentaromativorans]
MTARLRTGPATLPAASVGVLLVVSLLGPFLAPHDPYLVDLGNAFVAPESGHWMGTDDLGRDVFSRVLTAAPLTLLSAIAVVIASNLFGVAFACLASLLPAWAGSRLMRLCDVALAIPPIIVAMAIVAVMGPSLMAVMIALSAAMWPGTARLMHTVLRETSRTSYVEAAGLMGVTPGRILLRHILPNSLDAILVHASLEVSGVIVMIAGLSFLGIGAPAPSADWGSMIADGRDFVTTAWWITAFPGLAITVSAVLFSLLGDALRVHLDPSLEGK